MERVGRALVPKERHMIDLNSFAEYILDKQISNHDDPLTFREQGSPSIGQLTDSDILFEDLGSYDHDEKQSEGNWEIKSYTQLHLLDAELNNLSPTLEFIANQQELGYYDITSPPKLSRMLTSSTQSPSDYAWENNAQFFPYNFDAFSVNMEDYGYEGSFQEY